MADDRVMLATHFWIRLRRDRVIAPTVEKRRLVSRTFFRLDRDHRLLAFGLADTHAHGLALCPKPEALELARRIERSLGVLLKLPWGFAPADWEPVDTVWHLTRAFWYDLGQCRHHGLDWDPLFESTNLPDLLGMRCLGGNFQHLLETQLPRITRAELLRFLGADSLAPADGPPERVVPAAERAVALSLAGGHSREHLRARRAALQVLWPQVPPAQIARLLGISRASVFRLRRRPVNRELVRAVRLQIGLSRILEP